MRSWGCLGRWFRALGVWLLVAVGVLLFGASSSYAATPSPAPVPTTGRGFVAKSWHCEGSTVTTNSVSGSSAVRSDDCAVTGWAELPAATFPAVQDVRVTNPLPVPLPVVAATPLPVVEQKPPATSTVVLNCGGPPSASPAPSPTPSASSACPVALEKGQAEPLLFGIGLLVLVATASFVAAWR